MVFVFKWGRVFSQPSGGALRSRRPGHLEPARAMLLSLVPFALCLMRAPLVAQTLATAPYEPTARYEQQNIQGWKVYVNRRLLEDHRELGQQAIELLGVKLYDIRRAVRPKALAKLREVPIWLEFEDRGFPCACYHPSRQWLADHGYNPEKAKAVEIANAATFLKWTLHQPSMVLHELTHAYHDRFLGGYGAPRIVAAYNRALEAKRYEAVLYYDGQKKPAYAMKAPEEYLAELTEAWFGANDFYPFVRPEVVEHDPEGAQMLQEVWAE